MTVWGPHRRMPAQTRSVFLWAALLVATLAFGLAMTSGATDTELALAAINGAPFARSRFGSQAVVRLRAAFERSRHPMLIADDQRRWVPRVGTTSTFRIADRCRPSSARLTRMSALAGRRIAMS